MTSSIHSIHNIGRTTSRVLLILCGALLMATNINTFVHSAGLFPGGFTGLSLLLQEALSKYLGLELPYSLFYWGLNLGPAIISFFYIGKRFTIFSCMMIWLTGLLADLMPQLNLTQDTLLCTVFGGVINGCAICCCLLADATSGGTDFIAIFISERTGRNAWNAIFLGNVAMLFAAGLLFDWNRALYSIIFQFTSTQVLNHIYLRYSKTTLLIISEKTDEIYECLRISTHHSATLFIGTGCYLGQPQKMLYTVVSSNEARKLAYNARNIDPKAFINILPSREILGRFYRKRND